MRFHLVSIDVILAPISAPSTINSLSSATQADHSSEREPSVRRRSETIASRSRRTG
jgi:hypothetical protein